MATMKAVQFHEYGAPEVLVVENVEKPEPGAGQLLVKVHAVGVHPFDYKVRKGLMQQFMPVPLPHKPGIDFAGTVEVVGQGVSGYAPGDPVFGWAMGTYAEYAIAQVGAVMKKPDSITFEEAAALPVGAGTAWAALFDIADVQKGQSVLIHGGAGGVGMYAVQLAHWKGAHVTATTSAANVDFVKGLGADVVIDYGTTRFEDVVQDVDAVIDNVGGDVLDRSWSTLKRGGILVEVPGQASEAVAQEHGVRTAPVQGQATSERLQQIAELVETGDLKVEIGKIFSLDDAAKAHAVSEGGHGRGRMLLRVAGR